MVLERIYSHQHFWNYNPGRQSWMTDSMAILKKDYGPRDLAILL
jgi:L-fuconolactonase